MNDNKRLTKFFVASALFFIWVTVQGALQAQQAVHDFIALAPAAIPAAPPPTPHAAAAKCFKYSPRSSDSRQLQQVERNCRDGESEHGFHHSLLYDFDIRSGK